MRTNILTAIWQKMKFIDWFILALVVLIVLCFVDIGIGEKESTVVVGTITHLTSSNVSTDFGHQSIYKAAVKGQNIAHVFYVSEEFYASYREGDAVHIKIKTMYSVSGEFIEYVLVEDEELTKE